MAVTANQTITRQDGDRQSYPVNASTTIYQATLVFTTATGYADDDTASGSNLFAGIAVGKVDNSAGSAGDEKVELLSTGDFTLTGTGFTQASVDLPAYATDNYTVVAAPAAGAVYVGIIKRYISSTSVVVAIDPGKTGPGADPVIVKTAAYTVTTKDSGKVFSTAGASGTVTFTMPAAVPGLKYRFYVGAAQELRIDPDGTETISLPSTGVAGAAGKYLTANAAGETVDVQCAVAGSWSVFGYTGTWTAEP